MPVELICADPTCRRPFTPRPRSGTGPGDPEGQAGGSVQKYCSQRCMRRVGQRAYAKRKGVKGMRRQWNTWAEKRKAGVS